MDKERLKAASMGMEQGWCLLLCLALSGTGAGTTETGESDKLVGGGGIDED